MWRTYNTTKVSKDSNVKPSTMLRFYWSNAAHDDSDSNSSSDPAEAGSQSFFPSLWDVLKVRYLLQWKISRPLPSELVDLVIDAAEFWPSVERSMERYKEVEKDRDQVLLKTVPFCYNQKVCPCKSLGDHC